MTDDLKRLEQLVDAMALNASPKTRRKTNLKIATDLRLRNTQRIAKNIDPDGNKFIPRLRDKHGKVKTRAFMFKKLRALRHLMRKADTDGLEVGFMGGADARIAKVHHYGLHDRVDRGGAIRVKYARRPLLGFNRDDEDMIMDNLEKMLDL